MSSNPPDPNELLKLLVKQQQQQQLQQQQQQQQQQQMLQQMQAQQQARLAPAPLPQNYQQSPAPPTNAGAFNLLGNLMADYLKAPGASTAAGLSPAMLASLMSAPNNNTQMPSLASGPAGASEQQLLALSNLLSSANPSLSSQPLQQSGLPSQSQPNNNQAQAIQHQQQQGIPTQLNQLQQGIPTQLNQLNMQAQPQQQQGILAQQRQNNQARQQSLTPSSSNQPSQYHSTLMSNTATESDLSSANKNNSNVHTSSQTTFGDSGIVNKSNIKNASVSTCKAPEPVSLLTLQTWNLEQLESHARQLEECDQPVPKIVKVLLDDAKMREEKRKAKRLSNRKSATVSRARKRQLIDELTAENARLRRQALILSYLPDPVIALGIDGKIRFCNVQVERVFMHNVDDLVGASITDILVPESRGAIRRLIQDLVKLEHAAASGGGISNDTFRSTDQSFSVLEVNVKDQDEVGNGENVSDSSGDPSSKKDGLGGSRHESSSNDEPPTKKNKTNGNEVMFAKEVVFGPLGKPSSATDMNVDDVMGASVTANNVGAKLSSLRHRPEQETKGKKSPPQGSSSSTESDAGRRTGAINLSEDSGYMEDFNSNESSDDYAEDSSSLSRNSLLLKGNRASPLAPGCIVGLIRQDLLIMWCELTSCIRTRTHNDEDSELGIVDLNPKPVTKGEEEPKPEKELLLCLRPIIKGGKVEEVLRFRNNQISESNESGESTVNKSSSGSEGKESSDIDVDVCSSKNPQFSTETQLDEKNGFSDCAAGKIADADTSSNGKDPTNTFS